MLGFFEGVWQVIANLIEFVSQTISSINMMIKLFGGVLAFPVEVVNFVPAFLLTSIYLVAVVGIIKLVLGWGNS